MFLGRPCRGRFPAVTDDMKQHGEDLSTAFSRLQQSLRNYLRRRVSDVTQVDDLLQEIFVKALMSKRAGRQIDNLTAWLFAVARTTLVDHFRAEGHSGEQIDENIADIDETEDVQLHAEIASCLSGFIAELPPIYRDTLVATDLEGQTMRAIAEKQAVSVSAIKSRAARGRTMLKDKLLACCHVEMAAGLVSDYHHVSPLRCGGKCVLLRTPSGPPLDI